MATPEPNADTPWRSRGYLPHFDQSNTIQSITFRLADSLPQQKLHDLETELLRLPPEKRNSTRRKRIEEWLDSGICCCALAHPKVAKTLQNSLLRFDGDRYQLIAWCIMPNHVHALIEAISPLAKIVQSWKSYSGRWALEHNAELNLGITGKHFWMREYWDRYIRDADHYQTVLHYIYENPVKAKLCAKASDWAWSSASHPDFSEPEYSAATDRGVVTRRSTTRAELVLSVPSPAR